jgi:hypothetical protein
VDEVEAENPMKLSCGHILGNLCVHLAFQAFYLSNMPIDMPQDFLNARSSVLANTFPRMPSNKAIVQVC